MNDLPLFAYGTLLSGALDPAVRRLVARDAVRLGSARARGRLHDRGGYPGLRLRAGAGWVSGELLGFRHPESALRLLDRYEGIDPAQPGRGEYLRERVTVTTPVGREVPAWAYLLNPAIRRPGPSLRGGDWLRRSRGR